jgi:hypothetical protein
VRATDTESRASPLLLLSKLLEEPHAPGERHRPPLAATRRFNDFIRSNGCALFAGWETLPPTDPLIEAVLVFFSRYCSFLSLHAENVQRIASFLTNKDVKTLFVLNCLASFLDSKSLSHHLSLVSDLPRNLLSVCRADITDAKTLQSFQRLLVQYWKCLLADTQLEDDPDLLTRLADFIVDGLPIAGDEFPRQIIELLLRFDTSVLDLRGVLRVADLIMRVLDADWPGDVLRPLLTKWGDDDFRTSLLNELLTKEFLASLGRRLERKPDTGLLFLVFCIARMKDPPYQALLPILRMLLLMQQFTCKLLQIFAAFTCREAFFEELHPDFRTNIVDLLIHLLATSLADRGQRTVTTAFRLLLAMTYTKTGVGYLKENDIFELFAAHFQSSPFVDFNCSCAIIRNALQHTETERVMPFKQPAQIANRLIHIYLFEVSAKDQILHTLVLLVKADRTCIQKQYVLQFAQRLAGSSPRIVGFSLELMLAAYEHPDKKNPNEKVPDEVLLAVVEALRSASNQHLKVVRAACQIVLAVANRVDKMPRFFKETGFLLYLDTFLGLIGRKTENEDDPKKRVKVEAFERWRKICGGLG